MRYMFGKSLFRLLHQFLPIRQKENIGDKTVVGQHIHKGHGRPGLSGSRSHDKERFPAFL